MKRIKNMCIQAVEGLRKNGCLVLKGNNGAITLEYAITMIVAATLMAGVYLLFSSMAVQIINRIKIIAQTFP